jgi:hypothetical protein
MPPLEPIECCIVDTVARAKVHSQPPFAGATLHPSFGAAWARRQATIVTRAAMFRRKHFTRGPGALTSRRDDVRGANPTQHDCSARSCQAKIAIRRRGSSGRVPVSKDRRVHGSTRAPPPVATSVRSQRPLKETDFVVVTPYNMQVRLLRPHAPGRRAGRCAGRHRRRAPGARGARGLLLDGHFERRERAAHPRLSLLARLVAGRGNRAGPGRDLHDTAVPAVLHHDPARVARQALGRFRGNAHAVLQDGLARRVGIREHGRRFRGNVTQVGEGPASRLCS